MFQGRSLCLKRREKRWFVNEPTLLCLSLGVVPGSGTCEWYLGVIPGSGLWEWYLHSPTL
jgi:hypothetical protein